MREFKFRVWSQAEKEWSNPSMLEVWDNSGVLKPFARLGYPIENYIIQQYTGLKDKNGEEIFEGDIVRGFNSRCIYQIVWDEYQKSHAQYVGFKLKTYLTDGTPYLTKWGEQINQTFDNHGEQYEIVGNIFENPELIITKPSKTV